ncbi:hypothetical protein HX004_01850 [Myroides sp. 1354]|uniref:hypothetical protein n=1 Tax=unclassified Myroides TaxID=2642485 RepID=UPI002575046E|nr:MULTISPECIES: hypothetical protein [unclassified Myroides]MDM1043418.1 hypothetical protein [Myroides sp. R163-1]MDM1054531.1 hypothetical protein [Myroides sp. 1354]MDM1067828.1 hypothetical protein [Myroides sp. 1372]
MKKLLLFLFLTTLVTMNVACSSSDDKKEEEEKALSLVSNADGKGIPEGTSVMFTVTTNEGEKKVEVSGVAFYMDGKEIGNPYVFEKAGTFNVVAKKNGFLDSNVVVIKVVEDDVVIEKETLTIAVIGGFTDIEVEEEIRFEVKDEEGGLVENAEISLSDGTVIGYAWTPTAVGTYKIKAKKEGYNASAEITVNVKAKSVKKLVLTLESNAEELYVNENFKLNVKDVDGEAVSDAVLYKDGVATTVTSVDGSFQMNIGTEGTYVLKANLEGGESNNVTVKIRKRALGVENSFLYKESTYNVTNSTLFFLGIESVENQYVAVWHLEAREADGVTARVVFHTPATLVNPSTGDFSYQRPGVGNTIPKQVRVMRNNTLLDQATQGITFVFNARMSGEIFEGDYFAIVPSLGGKPFVLNFDGNTAYIDQSGARGSAVSAQGRQGNPIVRVSQINRR